MTSKRYHKLMRALANNIIEKDRRRGYPHLKEYAGELYRGFANSDPINISGYKSYQEAWDGMLNIREKFGMADITR